MKICAYCCGTRFKLLAPSTVSSHSEIVFGYKWTPDTRKTYELIRCLSCKHIFALQVKSHLAQEYVDVADTIYLENSDLRVATAESVLPILRKYISEGKLLDFGCGTGEFLEIAQRYFEVHGVELSSWAAKQARDRLAKRTNNQNELIFEEEIGSYPLDNFDLVTLWGVIEHLERPDDVIEELKSRMKLGSIMAFWTGDASSIVSLVLGKRWWYVIGQHVNLFSELSLNLLMKRHGFERIHRTTYPYTMRLGYLGVSMQRYPFLFLISAVLKSNLLKNRKIKLLLPGEMLMVYRKIS